MRYPNDLRLLWGLILVVVSWGTALSPATCLDPAREQEVPSTELEIITWNVLVGFQNKSQLGPATRWLAKREPDVVALQEMNGFTEASLLEASTGWGHRHVAMAKEAGYPVALTSRTPIEVVTRGLEGMHHGYLHARTAGLDVIVIHLHPGDWEFRRREAARIALLVEQLLAENRDVVVMGDFNAHHPLDCAHLAGQEPLRQRRAEGKNLILGTSFDYGTLARIVGAGLDDPVERLIGPSVAAVGTFPTRVLGHSATPEAQRGFLERIDFILVSRSLTSRCSGAELPREDVLDQVSDHYPVTLSLTRL